MRSSSRVVRALRAAVSLTALASPPAAPREPALPVTWARVEASLRGDEVAALAFDPQTGRLAIGDARGVLLGRPGAGFRRVLRRGPVRDLAFLAGGALLASTGRGLVRVDSSGRAEQVPPGVGGAAGAVGRIAAVPGAVAVATGDGPYLSSDGRRWRRLSPALPSGAASAVGLRRQDGWIECWTAIDGQLWVARLAGSGSALAAGPPRREPLRFAVGDREPVEIAFGLPGAEIALLWPAELALRPPGASTWERIRPPLPPGARARRLAFAVDRFWLATDRGLLEARALGGSWRRARPPAGSLAVLALAAGPTSLFAATRDGVWEGSGAPAPPPLQGTAGSLAPDPGEPAVDRVHRRALAYLDLRPERFAALRRGLSRRGWLPTVSLRGGYQRDASWGVDRDQSFVYGALRRLVDRDRDRSREWEISLTVSWDLGDLAYHPEEIDLSREMREVIELRDDVLDEITQLYFERQRILASLSELSGASSAEALRLRLRAAELAAGIDAWTGGWFHRPGAPPAP